MSRREVARCELHGPYRLVSSTAFVLLASLSMLWLSVACLYWSLIHLVLLHFYSSKSDKKNEQRHLIISKTHWCYCSASCGIVLAMLPGLVLNYRKPRWITYLGTLFLGLWAVWILQWSTCKQWQGVCPLSSSGVKWQPCKRFTSGKGEPEPFLCSPTQKAFETELLVGSMSSIILQKKTNCPLILFFFFPDPGVETKCVHALSTPMHVN